jgi:hypothetical protein
MRLALDEVEKSLMHFWAAISAGLCGGGDPGNFLTISRTWDSEDPGEEILERDFLSEILDSNGNWPVNQIRSCNSL